MTKLGFGSRSQRPRILVVDDDAMVLRSLARILRREFDVVTAANADDAFAKIADALHAIVTDHDLGAGPSGRAVLEQARLQAPRSIRVLISGHTQIVSDGKKDLWHAMLLKPVSRVELFATLKVPPAR